MSQAGAAGADSEALLADLGAGVRLLTGMLGLTVALLPATDRAFVLNALAALQDDSGRQTAAPGPQLAAHASAEAARALTVLIERFSLEVAAARLAGGSAPAA